MENRFYSQTFHSPTDGSTTLFEIIQKIKTFIEEDPEALYTLVVGSDSHERREVDTGKHFVQIVSAIVVHRRGYGGKYFWFKDEKKSVYSLREKIYAETLQSLELAKELVPLLRHAVERLPQDYSLEIHVDVGEVGDTREMIQEIVGMVTGFGFVARTKPDSYAASYVADKHT